MKLQDISSFQLALDIALRRFDWTSADALIEPFVESMKAAPASATAKAARVFLAKLRKKRRFGSMQLLVQALPAPIAQNAQVRRQIAQALIEQGKFPPAEDILLRILDDCKPEDPEANEAKGLLGRIYKQRYVDANADGGPFRSTQPELQRAIDSYSGPYELDRDENYWHGINLVACLDRGRRDRIAVTSSFEAEALVRQIRSNLETQEQQTDLMAYQHATILECLVAQVMMQMPEAAEAIAGISNRATEYIVSEGADAFEINSTLRQLVEVWQLTEEHPPGSEVLPVLSAALLERVGGEVQISGSELGAALRAASVLENKMRAAVESQPRLQKRMQEGQFPDNLEKKFSGGYLGAEGWRLGLERTSGVARIELWSGLGIGTGWLVEGSGFFNDVSGPLLLTNAHVIPAGSLARSARARFQDAGEPVGFKDQVLWSSPLGGMDATFLELDPPASAKMLPTTSTAINCVSDPPQYLYIIGHPGGGNLAFSVNDNRFLARNSQVLHYRTPTERGSSGSPVFDPDRWEVVALHHAGANVMNRLEGPGTYEANEGICICWLRQETKKAKVSRS